MNSRRAIVLAAGHGTRMLSELPKVLHPIAGRSSLAWVLGACVEAGCRELLVVVGPDAEPVRRAGSEFDRRHPDAQVRFVEQTDRLGTGHAVQVAVADLCRDGQDTDGSTLIVYADNPLLTAASLERLFEAAERGWASLSMATVDEPGRLGRVLCNDQQMLNRIVEYADASNEERAIRQVNAGQYVAPLQGLRPFLEALEPANAQGELYLTDAFIEAARAHPVQCVELGEPREALGINTRADLAIAEREMRRRMVERWLALGVTIVDPDRVHIGGEVRLGRDVTLHPDVWLGGQTEIADGCELHQGSWLLDSQLAADVTIFPYSVLEGARVGPSGKIGPFARLRPGAELEEHVRIGNFVEVKKSQLGAGVKANHLAYLGDAEVGAGSNIGAGVVTCNYDGKKKHKTTVGAGAFIGSDTMLVAPVTVGDGALTGAGSVVTDDVPDDSLALGRARQRNLVGWSKRQRD